MAGLLKPRNTSGPVLRCLALLGLLTARSFTPGAAADSPAPLNPIQALAVQRSAALFAASTPTHAFPVRVVIYGQSISQQWWSWDILRELPWWHPDTVFTGENRSITSFDTDYLIQTAEADIFAFRPDLIIFQAYGPYGAGLGWEKILRAFRARTTADVILVGNHPLLDAELEEPTEPALIPPNTQAWLNYIFTPALTGELGFCFPDNRSLWKAYLRTNQLPASALLKDTIHFTPRGSDLLKAILRPYLCAPLLSPGVDPFNNGRVRTYPITPGRAHWVRGRLKMAFVGNRLDVIPIPGLARGCSVRIDDQEPTSLPSGRGHGRSSSWKGEPFYRPALLHVGFQVKPLAENWRLTVTEVQTDNPKVFRFTVAGSVTGADGAGVSTNDFVSHSGRVVIGSNNWNIRFMPSAAQLGAVIEWPAEIRAVDHYFTPFGPAPVLEPATTLINDLPDGPHVLELTADDPADPPSLAALRIYHPGGPMPGTELPEPAVPTLRCLIVADQWLNVWPATAVGWQLSTQTSLGAPAKSPTLPLTKAFGFQGHLLRIAGDSGFFRLERR